MLRTRPLAIVATLAAAGAYAGGGPYTGPTPYTTAGDNPFMPFASGVCLETFEDGTLDPPGVTSNGSLVSPSGITDSVDDDDGLLDGSGNGGHSFFGSGPTGVTFTFDPQRPGGLPTQAGMVWTDGAGTISFEAFDQNGASLGVFGPFDHADGVVTGTTAEDRFYGVTHPGGVTSVKLSNTSGGIEVDHLTLNNCVLDGVTTTTTTATTTTLPTGCASVPVGATFASLNCRLAALVAAAQTEPQLGKQQSKLVKAAETAKARKEAAEAKCAGGDAKKANKQLKKVVRKLIQFAHRLRSNNARKNIPEGVREPLAVEADAIQADARALRTGLGCT